ncbi:pleckstrin homology domain-containing family G member 4B-like isoform X2 [Polyodon spathula]|uniref:pleckstrin homology domain-containing family G member 4B-like isoform X2 n=1 Tax=Polyodon spathula TaxID=7913 RepID=UPI001B7EED99|nr:pleckstrin homology domain-containing family G member 4B-like isoform X2 [Polyodon spathula]
MRARERGRRAAAENVAEGRKRDQDMGSEAVEDCVQGALSSLYPPFEVTAPPLLSQVFTVLEGTYRHDSLRYLVDFFIPAKHLLQRVQQQACSQYVGFLFLHEGWPLCLHEKVVVHLSTLDWKNLQPGDFYLQVVPFSARAPRLAVKCLSTGGRTVQEILVPESDHGHIFTPEWLNGLNKERTGARLQRCLLISDTGLVRAAWEEVVYPQFIHKPGSMVGSLGTAVDPGLLMPTAVKGDMLDPPEDPKLSEENKLKSELEGEYVELLEVGIEEGRVLPGELDSKRRYLEVHGISKTKTMPLCKGQIKGKSRRHKAWLHHRTTGKHPPCGMAAKQTVGSSEDFKSSETTRVETTPKLTNFEKFQGEMVYVDCSSESEGGICIPAIPVPSREEKANQNLQEDNLKKVSLKSVEGYDCTSGEDTQKLFTQSLTQLDEGVASQSQSLSSGAGASQLEAEDRQPSGKEPNKPCGVGSSIPNGTECSKTERTNSTVLPLASQGEQNPQPLVRTVDPQPALVENYEEPWTGCPESECLLAEGDTSYAVIKHKGSGDQSLTGASLSDKLVQTSSQESTGCKSSSNPNSEQNPVTSRVGSMEAQKEVLDQATGPGQEAAKQSGIVEDKATATKETQNRAHGTKGHRRKRKGKSGKAKSRSSEQTGKRGKGAVKERSKPSGNEAPGERSDIKATQTPRATESSALTPDPAATQDSQAEDIQPLGVRGEPTQLPTLQDTQQLLGILECDCTGNDLKSHDITQTEIEEMPRSTDNQSEQSSADHQISRTPEEEEEEQAPADQSGDDSLQAPPLLKDLNPELLQSGVLTLPGTRDKAGRALVVMETHSPCWQYPVEEIVRTLSCFYSLTSSDGLTVLLDSLHARLSLDAFTPLLAFQEKVPNAIGKVLVLVEEDSAACVDTPSALQVELVQGVLSLQLHIEPSQLPDSLGGTCTHCHREWLSFQLRLESFSQSCRGALSLLGEALGTLDKNQLPDSTQAVQACVDDHQLLMKTVLADERLTQLQREGGAILAHLCREAEHSALSQDDRDSLAVTFDLYNGVDDALHRLVRLSNERLRDLEELARLGTLENKLEKVLCWVTEVGEPGLGGYRDLGDSLELLRRKQREFTDFSQTAVVFCRDGYEVLQQIECWDSFPSPRLRLIQGKVPESRERLQDFSAQVGQCRSTIDKTLRLYEFFSEAYDWSLEVLRHLSQISPEDCSSPTRCGEALSCLQQCCRHFPEIPDSRFSEAQSVARELDSASSNALQNHWTFARTKYMETHSILHQRLESAQRAQRAKLGGTPSRSMSNLYLQSQHNALQSWGSLASLQQPFFPEHTSTLRADELSSQHNPCGSDSAPPSPFPWLGNPLSKTSSRWYLQGFLKESSKGPDNPIPVVPAKPNRKRNPSFDFQALLGSRRASKDTGKVEDPGKSPLLWLGRTVVESKPRQTGVHIKGLEVSSTEVVDQTCSPKQHVLLGRTGALTPSTPWGCTPLLDRKKQTRVLQLASALASSELEYVSALRHVEQQYLPEAELRELPQDLRGKRGVLFANWEKLTDFHTHYLLPAIEGAVNQPHMLGDCFLRHKQQFGLYSLYIKNKPRSDALLASQGSAFFKRRQQELRDPLELGRYLQAPVLRLQQYCEVLEELVRDSGQQSAQHQSVQSLQSALAMLRFTVRHGEDLRASDCITASEVSLSEQGPLLRQDEFVVLGARKKVTRQMFLFEEMLLFTKHKSHHGGKSCYIYKHSVKTADIGLTENIGDSGTRFEIWIRHSKSREAYILQGKTPEVKETWTRDIARLLWRQAMRNKELRLQESVSMGMGSKPFLDIQSSAANICDRNLDYVLSGRGSRSRASVAVSSFDSESHFRRSPSPLLSLGLGPLDLHLTQLPPSIREEEETYTQMAGSSGSSSCGSGQQSLPGVESGSAHVTTLSNSSSSQSGMQNNETIVSPSTVV